MAENQFAGALYRTRRLMLDAIAYDWLTSRGHITDAERQILADETDEALAAECIRGWELDAPTDVGMRDYRAPSHMDAQDYTESDLAAAFGRLREAVAKGEIE